ncbi:hypothetical protein BCR24_13070 [Enterococcus ureilyticus]|uniref:RNA polymerase subunit sigma-70 n=1 Tax=Enterococcus ureilyticus TaxID=1131292 RepID=A0A1E5HE70_9ENTE|nr:sigma-70 family RNA polymerase sigma factor [Enterococcus ureilyticus]MBM7689742.1 RNA polymerase sigma-70 factor (ECF subfamily) [Enterococcus ureilyticus]MBO0446003.1 sigma-70 family RNA polymerase sigma factor [Enterococcus ureilyticus]OEG23239.1 hypothetical protein BCR24_13070 [Enterococcus ureilyticus]
MVKMTTETITLVKKAKKGDDSAFEKLLKEQYEYIYRTAYHYASSEQDILDIIQEATIEAYKGIAKLKSEQYFYTWYIRILIRVATKLAKKANSVKQVNIEDYSEDIINGDNKHELEQELDLIHSFKKIDKKYTEVLQLFYYQDLSIQEISHILNVPVGTVKTNLFRGKQKLKSILGGDYFER